METASDAAQLFASINKADIVTLRTFIKISCNGSDAFRAQAKQYFLLPPSAVDNKKRKPDSDDLESNGTRKKARSIARYETCRTCDKVFDVAKNDEYSCRTHTGMQSSRSESSEWLLILQPDLLDIDEDVFPDDDELRHCGAPDDWTKNWRYKVNPKGFIWQCCDRDATEKPCQIRKHVIEGQASPAGSDCATDDEEEEEASDDD